MKKSDLRVGLILVDRNCEAAILKSHEQVGLYLSHPEKGTKQQIATFLNDDLECVVTGREAFILNVFSMPTAFEENDIMSIYQGTPEDLEADKISIKDRELLWERN